jgi:hypothetical protein
VWPGTAGYGDEAGNTFEAVEHVAGGMANVFVTFGFVEETALG